MVQLNYRDSKPIYEQIKDGLRKLVISGSLLANEKLPSVCELASGLAINPNTIERAYRDLEKEGYIYTVAGRGAFVAEQQRILDTRQQALLEKFDETVEELFFLSVEETELTERVNQLARGGKRK